MLRALKARPRAVVRMDFQSEAPLALRAVAHGEMDYPSVTPQIRAVR